DRPARIESEHQPAGDLDRIVGPEAEQASEVFVDVVLDERQRARGGEPRDDGREDIVAQRTRLADDLPRAALDDGQGQRGTGRLGAAPPRGGGGRLRLSGGVRLIRPTKTDDRWERLPPTPLPL